MTRQRVDEYECECVDWAKAAGGVITNFMREFWIWAGCVSSEVNPMDD